MRRLELLNRWRMTGPGYGGSSPPAACPRRSAARSEKGRLSSWANCNTSATTPYLGAGVQHR